MSEIFSFGCTVFSCLTSSSMTLVLRFARAILAKMIFLEFSELREKGKNYHFVNLSQNAPWRAASNQILVLFLEPLFVAVVEIQISELHFVKLPMLFLYS